MTSNLVNIEYIRPIYGHAAATRILTELDHIQAKSATFERNLLQIPFLLPITHKNQRFNLPLKIIFPINYPVLPPSIFLAPRPEMQIADRHPHADRTSGTVYHPYLACWSPASTLLDLLYNHLAPTFSAHPPLYTVARPMSQHAPSPAQPAPSRPHLTPSSHSISFNQPHPSSTPAHQPARLQPAAAMQTDKDRVLAALHERTEMFKEIFDAELQEDLRHRDTLTNDQQVIATASHQLQESHERLTGSLVLLGQALSHKTDVQSLSSTPADEIVQADSVVNQQLLNAVANDNAHADLLYQLEKALIRNVIPLDVWMRLCRQIARDQFFEKALAIKISRYLDN